MSEDVNDQSMSKMREMAARTKVAMSSLEDTSLRMENARLLAKTVCRRCAALAVVACAIALACVIKTFW